MERHRNKGFSLLRFGPSQFVLYGLIRFGVMFLEMCPRSAALGFGEKLGSFLRIVDRRRRVIAEDNIRKAGLTEDVHSLLGRLYTNLGIGAVESIYAHRLIRKSTVSRYLKVGGAEYYKRARVDGKGAIVVIGHLGNWELIGFASGFSGYSLHSIARPMENPYLDRWLNQTRTASGQRLIQKYGALRAMINALRNNQMLVIQVDQHARSHGIFVDFFGRPASTVRSPALLSLKCGAPIIPAEVYRDSQGIHHCDFTEPILPEDYRDDPDAVRNMTQAFTTRLEKFVRAHPDQWNWLHRRWRKWKRKPIDPVSESKALPDSSSVG